MSKSRPAKPLAVESGQEEPNTVRYPDAVK
jgi:hypothetical protein